MLLPQSTVTAAPYLDLLAQVGSRLLIMSDCSRTVDHVKTSLQSSQGLDSQQRVEFYNSWAETYEQDLKMLNYKAPNLVVNFLDANFPESRDDVQVLDVACGSGLVAKLMVELGFRHFVGVDGSKGMLDRAAKTGLYQELRLALLGTEALPAQTDSFDLVIIVGALGEGFVPVSVVRELCQVTKPGGYVCMSRINLQSDAAKRYKASMVRELQLMEDEGLWTLVNTENMDKYMVDVYGAYEDGEKEQFVSGTMYLYRKSLK